VVLSLSSLAGWEDAVLASIGGASGSLEERDRQIERSGMYGEYPAIVRAYAELFADADSSLEALKRAVFLVWRGAMELPSVTGIAPLPDGTARSIMDALDARIARGATDDELAWMLAWYHAQGPYVLELYGATPRVLTFAEAGRANGWEGAAITPARMAQRGQLGRYWTSLAAGAP
jgi:hypothetical protein